MTTLAEWFEHRFRREFPECGSSVRFVEYLPSQIAESCKPSSPQTRLKDLFRSQAQARDLLIYNTLRMQLPDVPPLQLEHILQNMIEGESGHFYIDARLCMAGRAPDFYQPNPRSVIVGPDASRTVTDLLEIYSQSDRIAVPESGVSEKDLLTGLRLFLYDHETAHALHIRMQEDSPKDCLQDDLQLQRQARKSPFSINDLHANFRERVADVYATFRLAAAGLHSVARCVADYRIHETAQANTISHFTTSAIVRALNEDATAQETPQMLFQRALALARACPLRLEETATLPHPNFPSLSLFI